VVVYFTVYSLGLVDEIENPGLLLAGWLYTAWFFSGVGLLLSAWTETWEVAEKFIQPAQYLALPLSGVFFMVSWVPGYAQDLLLLNPMVHCFEMFRAGFFGNAVETHYNVFYLTVWCCVSSVCGVAAVYRVRDKVAFN